MNRPSSASAAALPARPASPDWAIDVPFVLSLIFLPLARSVVTACWAALAVVLAWRLARGEVALPFSVKFGVWVYLLSWGVSVLGSVAPWVSFWSWVGIVGACVPVVAVAARRPGAPVHPAVRWTWLLCALVLGAWLVGERLTGHFHLSGTYARGLAYPMMPNSNGAAQYSLVLFAWTFAMALDPREKLSGWARAALWLIPAALVAAGGSRTTWVPFAVVALGLAWWRGKPVMGLAALAFFAGCSWLFPQAMLTKAWMLKDVGDLSIRGRLQGWETALRMFAERPFSGQGLGAWPVAWTLLRRPEYAPHWPHAHSFYFNTLALCGVLGLAGFAAYLAGFHRLWRAGLKNRESSGAEQAMAFALLALALASMTDLTFWAEPGYFFFALTAFTWRTVTYERVNSVNP